MTDTCTEGWLRAARDSLDERSRRPVPGETKGGHSGEQDRTQGETRAHKGGSFLGGVKPRVALRGSRRSAHLQITLHELPQPRVRHS